MFGWKESLERKENRRVCGRVRVRLRSSVYIRWIFTFLLKRCLRPSVRACTYFGLARSHACSLGAIYNQSNVEWDIREICLSNSWSAAGPTCSWEWEKKYPTLQVMGAIFPPQALHNCWPALTSLCCWSYVVVSGHKNVVACCGNSPHGWECYLLRGILCNPKIIWHNRRAQCVKGL